MLCFCFASSSDFVLPILNSIYHHQGQNLSEIAQTQAKNLPLALLPEEFAQIWVQLPSNFWSLPLLNQKYELGVVITQPAHQNHGKTIKSPIESWATEHKIKTFTPEKIGTETEALASFKLDLGIVASYGQLLSSKVLAIPNFGWINWHPSKLPKYRGPTPMQSFIASGANQTALTWIEMTKGMDAGDMILQVNQELEPTFDIVDLALKMGDLGANTWAIVACLHLYQQTFEQYDFSIAQSPSEVSICQLLQKSDAHLKPETQTAWQIYNHFRAYKTFPGSKFFSQYFKQDVKIVQLDFDFLNSQSVQYSLDFKELLTNSGVLDPKYIFGEFYKLKNQVFIICQDQTLLPVKTLQLLETNNRISLAGYNF